MHLSRRAKRTAMLLGTATAFLLLLVLTACGSSKMIEPVGVGSDPTELKKSPCAAMLPGGAVLACIEIPIGRHHELSL